MTARSKAARRRQRNKMPEMQPGMRPNVEDVVWGGGVLERGGMRMSLRPEAAKQPGPKVKGTERLSRAEVWGKLETAMKTLRAMPDRERRFFAVKSGYPDFVRDYIDAYASVEAIAPRFMPTPEQVSQYLDILAWARHLKRSDWQLLWWRSFGVSFGVIGHYIGRSDEAARKRFENALTDVWTAANGI